MGHPFGDLVTQYLHRRHGLSQARLAEGIMQPPVVVSLMCQGQRLTGPQARDRVLAIIRWMQQQGVLTSRSEANALLAAAGMSALDAARLEEDMLLQILTSETAPAVHDLRRGSRLDPATHGVDTFTFLFTSVEASNRHWEEHPQAMKAALARHDAILRQALTVYQGYVFKTVGDMFQSAFVVAQDAVAAAVDAQRALQSAAWPITGALRVRMALHTGTAEERDGEYLGQPLSRVAGLLDAAHGGQIILSLTTQELVRDDLPDELSLRDLGQHRLKDMIRPEHLYQIVAPGLPDEFPALRSLDTFRHNLPVQLTSFIGRDHEIGEMQRLLGETRLLTLTGAGGSGKTRLALHVAADRIESYTDGVWLVSFAAVSDPSLVPATIANALNLREQAGQPLLTTLTEYLRDKEMLLLFDNCEHLVDAIAPVVEQLLQQCESLAILATSREPLLVPGETTYLVPPLSHPGQQSRLSREQLSHYEAVRLFIERALAAQPSFRVTNANAPALAQICSHLDGIPLAIELAAARVRSLSLDTLLERLDDRFRILTGGNRTTLPRQQTLRALIDWSHDLLSSEERIVFRRLAAFPGSWTMEAAEAVCSDDSIKQAQILDFVTSLVNRSLVVMEEADGTERYRMLETIRVYAKERLEETDEAIDVRTRHATFFTELALRAESKIRSNERVMWTRMVEQEHDNMLAALQWLLNNNPEMSIQLITTMGWVWLLQGYFQAAREWLAMAIRRGNSIDARLRSKALLEAAVLAYYKNEFQRDEVEVMCETSLVLARESNDPVLIARCTLGVGVTAIVRGDSMRGYRLLEESLRLGRNVYDEWTTVHSLLFMGLSAYNQGAYDQAAEFFRESWQARLTMGLLLGGSGPQTWLGRVALAQHDYGTARIHLRQSLLTIYKELGNDAELAGKMEGVAYLAVAQKQPERAVRLLAAADALRQPLQCPVPLFEQPDYQRALTELHAQLESSAFQQAWEEGRAMSREQAVAYALEVPEDELDSMEQA